MFRGARHFLRLFRAARTLAQYDALFPLEVLEVSPLLVRAIRVLGRVSRKKNTDDRPQGVRLTAALQALGPSFIKLGQALATRPDLVGESVADDLTALQDRLPPFAGSEARAIIEQQLGASIESLFAEFDDQPIAAASIAQVHRATTSEGREVAVKVLRPNIEKKFAPDLAAFRWLAELVDRKLPDARRLRPVEVVEALTETVALEMDLRLEAAAASELRENTKEDPGFSVPEVDWPRTSKRVLTIEWVDGIPIGDRARLVEAGQDMEHLAATLIGSFLLQAMRDGFFHADLHQGNLFVDEAGTIVAVDFGIMGRVDRATRRYLAETLRGFHTGDYRRIAEVHFEAGYVPRHKSVGTFAQALRAIGEPIAGRPVKDISFGKLMGQLFLTTAQFDMQTQPELILLQKTMVMVEGLSLQLNPDINMWDVSPPILENWMQSNMGPTARAREGLEAALSLARNLPRLAHEAEQRINDLTARGIKLAPEAVEALARANRGHRRTQNVLLGVIAALLALLVLAIT